ncbi:MAG: polysaccharide deacetylase [Segetibacter sp.]|nr:polysaccharide deacetylase [Segetibacter sp.]
MMKDKYILLSFDVEEFDMPLEYNQNIHLDEQMLVGLEGLQTLMPIIESYPVEATFFATANFANRFPTEIKNISKKHEVASHTFYHSSFKIEDLLSSKKSLEEITGKIVKGLRMPRMRPIEMEAILQAGYAYDSSVNPTWIPGKYNNLHLSRNPYQEEGMLRFPASVSPQLRIPLFWLSFKNFPYALYLHLVKHTLKKDGYVCLYFHPWEFVDLDKYAIPAFTKRRAGKKLQDLLHRLITDLRKEGNFMSMQNYIEEVLLKYQK